MSVGMPMHLILSQFGSHVWAVFGSPPYLVGSALTKKRGWRDVDIRMMLSDEEWSVWGFADPDSPYSFEHDEKWVALTLAFSALGRQMTGLPIDFQLQPRTWANKKHDKPREGVGFVPHRMARYKESEIDRAEDSEDSQP